MKYLQQIPLQLTCTFLQYADIFKAETGPSRGNVLLLANTND